MKSLLAFLVLLAGLAGATVDERISLGSGRFAILSRPDTWEAVALPPRPPGMPAIGTTVRFAPKGGANEAVMITLVVVPNEGLAEPAELRTMAEMASRRFVRGSVEAKVDLKDFKVGGRTGYAATFTDAKLVGQASVPDDYKMMTCCYVYLGDRVLLTASIFSDDPDGGSYAAAKKIIQSITLSLPQNTI